MSAVGLWIDWAEDLSWGDANANCTDLLISATYTRGSAPEITGAAQAGGATFVVQNPAGLFDPDNAAGPLYGKLHDGVPVWFSMNEDGTITTPGTVRGRFAGRITEIAPLPVAGAGDSTPTAEIICEDALGWYGRTPVELSDDCSPPAVTPVQGAFDWNSGVPTNPWVPTLPHNTTPGRLLLLVTEMSGFAGGGLLTPALLNLAGGGTWTTGGTTYAYDSTQFGGPGPGPSIGVFWRQVAVGEVTTQPVRVSTGTGVEYTGMAWLWEIGIASTPSSCTMFTTGTTPGSGIASGGSATLPATTGYALGMLALQSTAYEYITEIVPIVGTTVQGCGGDNQPYASTRTWQGPGPGSLNDFALNPTWIGQLTSAGSMKASFTYDPGSTSSVLSPYGVAGFVVEIPGIVGIIPTIPWPANQVG